MKGMFLKKKTLLGVYYWKNVSCEDQFEEAHGHFLVYCNLAKKLP